MIYDFGANKGDNLEYYLIKADQVVAVEANPTLCGWICDRFQKELHDGRLVVLNCAVTDGSAGGDSVPFYISHVSHRLSTLVRPDDSQLSRYSETLIASRGVADIISEFGEPYYAKIDVEGYDKLLIRAMFGLGIYPDFISVECHDIQSLALLVACGKYNSFAVLTGSEIPSKYAKVKVRTPEGQKLMYFPAHSAGPFGADLREIWLSPDEILRKVAVEGTGWKDIHARKDNVHDGSKRYISYYGLASFAATNLIRYELPGLAWDALSSLYPILKRIRRTARQKASRTQQPLADQASRLKPG